MITEIGIVAGEIWQTLDQVDRCDVEQLSAALKRPRELILMSLGWLCREGHVRLSRQDDGYVASLKPRMSTFEG